MWWVRDAAGREGIGAQEVAELVMDLWNGNREHWQEQEARRDCQQSGKHAGPQGAVQESGEPVLRV
jgi:hypothetical protein